MNYLAHLHIAQQCNSDPCGNLLGDFVKGDPSKIYPKTVAQGIQLHRFVDSYTDSHVLVKDAKQYFPVEQRRFAGIALDMFWDHCLSKHWKSYSDVTLENFIRLSKDSVIQQQDRLNKDLVPENYLRVTTRMWNKEWLASYQHLHVMETALKNISQRRARFDLLAECYSTLENNYIQLVDIFHSFYPQVLNIAKEQ